MSRPVNSKISSQLTARLSARGFAVLRTLAASPRLLYVGLTVRELVWRIGRPGTSVYVTRASLSRTLRRLWRAGLVELSDGYQTLTECRQAARDRLAKQETDPVAAYASFRSLVAMAGIRDTYGSADAYMAAQRENVTRADLRATRVHITEVARDRLTAAPSAQLTATTGTVDANATVFVDGGDTVDRGPSI